MTLWLIGGLDPTRGAGVLRDALTAAKVEPSLPLRTVVTALTRQGGGAPAQSRAMSIDAFRYQLTDGPRPSAIKIGLVPDELTESVREFVLEMNVPTVVDPILRASDGGELGATIAGLLPLMRASTLVTPNREEAEALCSPAPTKLETVATRLGAGVSVLLKGGPFSTPESVEDLLWHDGSRHRWSNARLPTDPRGTGCALATAIAARLTRSADVPAAVESSIRWLAGARHRAVEAGDQLVLS